MAAGTEPSVPLRLSPASSLLPGDPSVFLILSEILCREGRWGQKSGSQVSPVLFVEHVADS